MALAITKGAPGIVTRVDGPLTIGGDEVTQSLSFGQAYIVTVIELVDRIEKLRILQDRIAQDSTLIGQYFAQPGARSDIAAADFNNASSAVNSLLAAFDGGTPTLKSALFKLL